MEQNMFCYQCQETAGCSGCTKSGVCGKRPETAALQDLLIWTTKGLSAVTTQLRREGKTVDASVNHLITENLFTTITNVNFDDDTDFEIESESGPVTESGLTYRFTVYRKKGN